MNAPRLTFSRARVSSQTGGRGYTYFADFLDCGAEGRPSPWGASNAAALTGASKFVAFVSAEYLTTFSCLQVRPHWPVLSLSLPLSPSVYIYICLYRYIYIYQRQHV